MENNETPNETNESDAEGTKDNSNLSELEKLKERNDEVEKELIRGRELRAETQKLEAEKMLGGETSGGKIHMTPEDQLNKTAEDEAKEIVDAFR